MSPHSAKFDPTSTQTRDKKGALKGMFRMLLPERPRIALVLVLTLISTLANVAAPKFLGDATNVIVAGVTSPTHTVDFHALLQVLGIVVCLYIIQAVTFFSAGIIVRVVMQNLGFKLRADAQAKIDRLPLSYIDRHARGDLLSRVTNDIDNINQTLMQTLNNVVTSIYMLIGILSMMLWISWSLALLTLLVLPLGMIALVRLLKLAKPQFSRQWKATGDVSSIVEESFTGLEVVSAFGMENDFEEIFNAANHRLFDAGFKGQFFSQLAQPLMSFISNLQFVLVAVIGGLQVMAGQLTIGGIQAFIQYARQLNHPVSTLASIANLLQSGAASAERIFDFLDTEEMEADATATYEQHVPAELRRGDIVFDHVSFSYNAESPVIRDLSVSVHPGQQIAIVGPTGAGKTTLVNLLMRFYEIDGGDITVDGASIRTFSKDSLRARIGMVLQDTWLFEGTIEENIAFGRVGASHADVVKAAQATGLDRLIRQLPEGYATRVSDEDSGLSAGEKQLLTIARAYISQPDILILDEATSSVDTRTEMLVGSAMSDLRVGRTSFVIAHRLSTIRGADTIIVMENGDVVEQGNHQQLMDARGAYYRLYQSQFAGQD
ncbi:MAG: ABC transporter ATP-binding protein [Actinomycetaceae bacterium]|nr:ABC transporter ATP-binding protein [Actinomycetaceae bacterium]MDY5854953.1 ABC transporter ATP-binding protein [Arcanobacterium sp.]